MLWVFFARVEWNQMKRSIFDDVDNKGTLNWKTYKAMYNPMTMMSYLMRTFRLTDKFEIYRWPYFTLPAGLSSYVDFWNGLDLLSLSLIFLTYAGKSV